MYSSLWAQNTYISSLLSQFRTSFWHPAILHQRVARFGGNTLLTKYRNTARKYQKYKNQGAPGFLYFTYFQAVILYFVKIVFPPNRATRRLNFAQGWTIPTP